MRLYSTLTLAAMLLAILAGMAVGLIVAVKSVNLEGVKELLATQVESATGRTLTITGPLKMHLGLIPRLVAGEVKLSNPPGCRRPEMMTIKHFEMEVALLPLLKREILVNRLIVAAPDILIETEAKGPGNLGFRSLHEKSESNSSRTESNSAYRLNLHEVAIEKGVVAWYDRGSGKTESVEINKLTLRPYQTSDDLLALQLTAKVRGHRVEIDGTVGRLDGAIAGNQWPVHLNAGIGGLAITVEGAIADLFAFRGLGLKLTARGDELYQVVQLAGVAKSDTPQAMGPFTMSARLSDARGNSLALTDVEVEVGRRDTLLVNAKGMVKDLLGTRGADLAVTVESDNVSCLSRLIGTELTARGPVKLSGRLRGSGTDWKMSGLQAGLAGSEMRGDLAVHLATRPHLSGKLAVNTLNLNDFTPPHGQPGEKSGSKPAHLPSGDTRLFSNQPLPVQALRLMDGDLSLQAGKVKIGEVQLTDIMAQLHLEGGRLALKPIRLVLAGGNVEGEVHLDVAGKVPLVGLHLTGRQVELGKLTDEGTISGAKSDLKIDLKGQGESVRALMATVSGETVLSVGEGRVKNRAMHWAAGDLLFQVMGALNPLAKSEETTPLSCAAARFTLRDGVATTDKGIAARTDKVDVVGSGTVDLRTEALDLGIRPRPRQGVGLSLSTPLTGLIRLSGTIANPRIGMDNEGTLRTAASVGAAAATGGLSLLGELLVDKVSADSDPCRTALGLPPAKQKGPPPQKEQPQKPKGDSLFRGLFGR